MTLQKIKISPIIGLMISIFIINIFAPTVSFADEVKKSRKDINFAANHRKSGVIVSMGDSYSAGEGIEPFYGSRFSEGWELQDWLAHRSQDSWGSQLTLPTAGTMGYSKYPESSNPHWYFVAVSGAVTWDINHGQNKTYLKPDLTEQTVTLDPQIDIFNKVKSRQVVPDYITLTLGGNDLGFVQILTTAAINVMFHNPCVLTAQLEVAKYKLQYSYENENHDKELSIKDKIKNTLIDIDKAARIGDDQPCILVAGYPHLLNSDFMHTKLAPGDIINAFTVFTPNDAKQINDAIDLYCTELQVIVEECQDEGLNIEYVEVRDEFEGHEVNTPEPWINGFAPLPREQDLDLRVFPTSKYDPMAITGLNLSSGASLHPNIYGATDGYRVCFQNKIDELEDKYYEGLTETPPMDPVPTVSHVGSEITMGNYAGEDVEWIVLDETDNDVLLLSKYALDAKNYNDKNEDVTWEKSSLRDWLNKDFYNNTFSSTEKELIHKSFVYNPENAKSENEEDKYDYMFLLSTDEANRYFSSDDDRKAHPTDYAFNNGIEINNGGDDCCYWWLRSRGTSSNSAACVLYDGTVSESGLAVNGGNDGTIGIRPAMWVSKSDLTFVSAEPEIMTREGNHVIFGHYEQDGDLTNGPEPIEWEIVTEQDGKMLLISKYILDCQPYNTEDTEVTWETCSLRQWLNNDFYNTAFNESERGLIETTTLSNPDNPFGGKGGNSTDDKVFCLSVEEVYRYLEILYQTDNNPYGADYSFSLDFLREVTQYARDRGVVHRVMPEGYFDFTQVPIDESDLVGKDFGNWWLRSPANSNNRACVVFLSGQAGYGIEEFVHVGSEGVRPAMWIDSGSVNIPDVSSANEGVKVIDSPSSMTLYPDDDYDLGIDSYSFKIPMVVISGVDTDSANKEIEEEIMKYFHGENCSLDDAESSSYHYYISDKIVSIIVYNGHVTYEYGGLTVFNIDIATGRLMDNSEIVSFYGMSDDEFFAAAYDLYVDFNNRQIQDWSSKGGTTDYEDYLKQDLNFISYDYIDPYIGLDGHLCFVGIVRYYGGSGEGDMLFDTVAKASSWYNPECF